MNAPINQIKCDHSFVKKLESVDNKYTYRLTCTKCSLVTFDKRIFTVVKDERPELKVV